MLKKIHHVGIVVRSVDEAMGFYRDMLGLPVAKDEVLADHGVRGVLLPAGETEIELLEPTQPDTAIAHFLGKGEGLHHICFETDDVDAELIGARAKGIELIDQKPRRGLAGMIGFLHPQSSRGVLIEFATPLPGVHIPPPGPTVRNFDHVVVAARDLDGAAQTFSNNFDLTVRSRAEVPGLGIRNVVMPVGSGNGYLEIVSPLGKNSPVEKFLDERGEGLFLISLEVADLGNAVGMLRDRGVRVGDPVPGSDGNTLAFISPRNTHGVSIQLLARGGGH